MKVKIKEIFSQNPISNKIYLISDQNKLIYVGMAKKQSVQERLSLHIADFFKAKKTSQISKMLFDNCPDYFEWQVECLSISDAEKITGHEFDCLLCAEQGVYDYFYKKNRVLIGNKVRPRRCKLSYQIYDGFATASQINGNFFSYIPGIFENRIKIIKKSGDIVFTNLNTCNSCNEKLNIGSYVYYVYGGLKRKSIFCSKDCMNKALNCV